MANEITKVTDQNGVDHPFKDVAAFPRSEQAVLGAKNLLENKAVTTTGSGIQFVVNADKSVTIKQGGTATGDIYFPIYSQNEPAVIPKGDYIISGGFIPPQDLSIKFYLNERNAGNTGWGNQWADTTGNGVIYKRSNDYHYAYFIYIKNGTTITSDITVKPMVRLASDPDATYAPYAMTNKELTEKVNGMVDYVNTTANNGNAYTDSLDDAPLGYTYCSSGCTNNPVNKWGVAETIKASSSAKIQKFYSVETDDFCIRRMVSSVWQAWQKVTTTSVS